jgi:ABC-type antimicrobial peptide transport system permease subunit
MYLSHEQFRFWNSPVRAMDLVVRARGEPGELAPLLRAEVRALDASLPVASVRTMEEVVSASLAEPRLLASLMAAFAAIALVLSTVGIYGVIAYTVGQRRREIGIRMALGAAGSRVLAMVLREGARMVAAGLLLGIAGAVLLGRAAEGAPAGDTAPDAVILAAVSAILGLVAMLACLAPAWRAMRTDPVEPLRGE